MEKHRLQDILRLKYSYEEIKGKKKKKFGLEEFNQTARFLQLWGEIIRRRSALSTRDRAVQEGDSEQSLLGSDAWRLNFMDNVYLIIDYISPAAVVLKFKSRLETRTK